MGLGIYSKLARVVGDSGKVVQFLGSNWKGLGVTYLGLNYLIKDKSLIEQGGDFVLGKGTSKTFKEEGLGGVLNRQVFGDKHAEKSLAENTVDTVAGQGIYQTIGEGIKDTRDAAGNLISGAVDSLRPGNAPAAQQYADPQTGYLPQHNMLNGGASQFTNPLNSITSTVGNMTGLPNTNPMNLAALVASGFLMFGNFGWMGKLISLITGNMALKSMSRQQQVAINPQQAYQQQMQMQQGYFPSVQQQRQQDNDNTVLRSRHL